MRWRAQSWQHTWYATQPGLVLRVLAGVFGGTVALRRALYRHGLLRSVRLPVPVLVVGNLAVGGSGKTPFVIWCARLLAAHGWRPAVLSRGYGARVPARPLAVFAHSDPARCGDEAVLIAREAGVPVYVHPRRTLAGQAAIAAGAELLICDDGLQHYALRRDLEIALVDGRRRFGNGALLPAGPLREPQARLAEVDFVVCKQGPVGSAEILMEFTNPRLEALAGGECTPLAQWAGRQVHAVAGIADPESFFAVLRGAGLRVIAHPRADHAALHARELRFGDGLPVILTGKDAVKCPPVTDIRCYRLSFDVALDAEFSGQLLARVEGLADGRKTAA